MNTFTCLLLNRIDQYNVCLIELIIRHNEGIIPEQRLWLNFPWNNSPEEIDDIYMEPFIQNIINNIITVWNEENI